MHFLLKAVDKCHSLRKLFVGGNSLGVKSCQKLASILDSTNKNYGFYSLSLKKTGLNSASFLECAKKLVNNKFLRILDISENNIGRNDDNRGCIE